MYNEEALLPLVLKNIDPFVDEIIVVDGGPDGESTDGTADIAKGFDKVVYCADVFKTVSGAWDVGRQKNAGIALSTGDIIFMTCADMFYSGLDYLREQIDSDNSHKLWFCSTVEFWLNTNHIRLYSQDDDMTTIKSTILQAMLVDKDLDPKYDDSGNLALGEVLNNDKVLVPQTVKFHSGWIRPFEQQVQKHIRHVVQRRWGPEGDELLADGESAIAKWAIQHVLSYPRTPCVAYKGRLPSIMNGLANMKYNQGIKEVIEKMEAEYGFKVFAK